MSVMAAVRECGTRLLEQAQLPDAIGVDETTLTRANATHSAVFAGVVDLDRARLIDIIPGESRKILLDPLSDHSLRWPASIGVAGLDPFRGYGAALSARLAHAVRVPDPFHVARLGSPVSTMSAATCNNIAAGRMTFRVPGGGSGLRSGNTKGWHCHVD